MLRSIRQLLTAFLGHMRHSSSHHQGDPIHKDIPHTDGFGMRDILGNALEHQVATYSESDCA